MQKHNKTKPNSKEVITMIKPPRSAELMTARGGSGTLDGAEADITTAKSEGQQQRSEKRGRRWMVIMVRTDDRWIYCSEVSK